MHPQNPPKQAQSRHHYLLRTLNFSTLGHLLLVYKIRNKRLRYFMSCILLRDDLIFLLFLCAANHDPSKLISHTLYLYFCFTPNTTVHMM